jgi:hypothetical protein
MRRCAIDLAIYFTKKEYIGVKWLYRFHYGITTDLGLLNPEDGTITFV